MNIHTPLLNVEVVPLLPPASRTANVNSKSFDSKGYEDAAILVHLGAHDHTTGDETLDMKVTESDDDFSTAGTLVTGATFTQITTTTPDANRGNVYGVNLNLSGSGRKRYFRVEITVGGTTPIDVAGILALGFNPRYKPVTQPAQVAEVLTVS